MDENDDVTTPNGVEYIFYENYFMEHMYSTPQGLRELGLVCFPGFYPGLLILKPFGLFQHIKKLISPGYH